MFSGSWQRSLVDSRVKRGADVGSDQHMVVAGVRVKLRRLRSKRLGRQDFDVEKLKNPKKKSEVLFMLLFMQSLMVHVSSPGRYGRLHSMTSMFIKTLTRSGSK